MLHSKKMKRVSIVVPVYNTAKYLRDCAESLVNQTLDDIEVIFIDNNCTDESPNIIKEFVKKYPGKVVSYKCETPGVSAARNLGVQKAKGEYIEFVDSDDYIEKNRTQKLYEAARERKLDVIIDNRIEHRADGTATYCDDGEWLQGCTPQQIFATSINSVTSVLVKKDILSKNNISFHEGKCYEDLIVCAYLAYTDKIGFIKNYGYHYVKHTNSITNTSTYNEHHQDIYVTLEDVRQIYKEEGIFEKYYQELEYRHIRSLLYASSSRFLPDKRYWGNFRIMHNIMKENFPNWRKNKYYLRMSLSTRICILLCYLCLPRIVNVAIKTKSLVRKIAR